MRISKNCWRFASLTLLAGVMTGCGQPKGTPAILPARIQAVELTSEGEVVAPQPNLFQLTEAQITQLQGILSQYQDLIALAKAQHAKVYGLLGMDTVDRAQLVKALSEHLVEGRKTIPELVAMVGQIRDALTPEQRDVLVQVIANRLEEKVSKPEDRELGELIGLDAEQRQLHEALGLEDMYRGMLSALKDFLETGDQQALANTLGSAFDLADVDKLSTVLVNLPLEMRKKLIHIGLRRDQLLSSGIEE